MQIEKTDTGIRVKRELEAGFFSLSTCVARGAHDSIRHQQAALCHADRHQAGENKPLRKVMLAEVHPHRENLQKIERLYVPQKTKRGAHRGLGIRDRQEAGRQTAQRIARAVKVVCAGSRVGCLERRRPPSNARSFC